MQRIIFHDHIGFDHGIQGEERKNGKEVIM